VIQMVLRQVEPLPPTPPPPPPPTPTPKHGVSLTPREKEVLDLLTLGLSNTQVAVELSITTHTAKFHVQSILDKLGAQSRTEAVVLAAKANIITI